MKITANKDVKINIRLSSGLFNNLKLLADKYHWSLSRLIRFALELFVEGEL